MEEYFKISTITGKKYNIFGVVRILNLYQVRAYVNAGAEILDMEFSEDKNHRPIVVFYFSKEDTKELYNKWCNYELT